MALEMKRYLSYIGVALFLLVAASCSDRFSEETGYGYISVNLTEDL